MLGGIKSRGYYLTVTPVTKDNGMIGFAAFTGHSKLLFETQRFTAKQFARAVEMSKAHEDELINAVVSQNKAA